MVIRSADTPPAPSPVSLGSGLPAEPVVARLTAAPGVQRVPSPKLTLFLNRSFLPPALCAALLERIDAVRRPSTISDSNGDASYRTSETGDLDPADPVVTDVEARIAALTGLDGLYGEPLQGQRYAVGQEFKGHTDYFEPTGVDYDRYCSVAGNRTWTVMVYLNQPEAGGATRFKAIDKIVQPETGKLLAWNNRRPDGSPNPATLHHGMKVRSGVKYVITKWYRERPWG
ncbi:MULTISPECIES: prolyl hydroxylase family protein [unclassified Sphingomonas]|uniref:prolyl hydroxylase family protein n=1 Tax=unclassified Sphingomonas TaxID=196159 RepID=UPI0005A5D544|nr:MULTISPECIES: 2OG-Fe(II) oxygenase [unclassified Sphingomonas]MDY1008417.1 2OG-Fe(II) oxygenase [Sphingomonas sp. CFBP9019]